jgi:hypothetical protein
MEQETTYCRVCRKSLRTVNYGNHLATASHQRNLLSSRVVEKVKCNICNKSILKRNIEAHLSKHSANLVRPRRSNNLDEIVRNLEINPPPHLELQQHIGERNNLVSLLIRFSNDELKSVREYSEGLRTFLIILSEQTSFKNKFIHKSKISGK